MELKLVKQTTNGNFIVDYNNNKRVILPLGGLAVPKDLSPQGCWCDNSNWGEIDDLWWEKNFPEFPKSIPYQNTLTDQEKQIRIKNSDLYKEFCVQLETLTKDKK
jgi:hypothetical protein